MSPAKAKSKKKSTGEAATISREAHKLKRELTLLPLFGLIYFTVCGGSFGIEGLVGWSGPGLAMLLIIVTPFIFSLPNVLMVRELQSMMPVEGGYYHWIKRAFGPFAGFMAGWNNWIVSLLDVSIYPVLAAYYLGYFIPALNEGTAIGGIELSAELLSWLVCVVIIISISALQVRGSRISGMFTNGLGILLMLPLFIIGFMGIYNWIRLGAPQLPFLAGGVEIDGKNLMGALSTGLFIVMWNYMGWELPSAAGDEVVNPKKTYPRAMALVLVASIITYLIPVMGGLYGGGAENGTYALWGLEASDENVGLIGDFVSEDAAAVLSEQATVEEGVDVIAAADPAIQEEIAAANTQFETWKTDPASATGWEFPQIGHAIAEKIGGTGLGVFMGSWLTIAAVLSMIGLFTGNSLGGSRVPFALAEDGMFPRWMVKVHEKFGTPWVAIAMCGVLYAIFSLSAFAFLVIADVFLQMLVILAEFATLWKLRFTDPDRPRWKVPGGIFGLVLVTIGPVTVILVAIISQFIEEGWASLGWAVAFMIVGIIVYFPFRIYLKRGVPDVDPFITPLEE